MIDDRLKLGKRKEFKRHGGWVSAQIKPSGRLWKRRASKSARKASFIANGGAYRRLYGWTEWC